MTYPVGIAIDPVFRLFGKTGTYRPPGGGPAVPCTLILDKRDREMQAIGQPMMQGTVIEVRAAEVAAPTNAGTFVIGSSTYTIDGDPITDDPDRLVWVCTVR